jgi:hypothetical protein
MEKKIPSSGVEKIYVKTSFNIPLKSSMLRYCERAHIPDPTEAYCQ